MLEQFPPIGAPDWGLGTDPEATVTRVRLGDGYEFRRPEGINHLKDKWSPTWSSLDPDVAEITHAWLKARLNWKAFEWVNPITGLPVKVLCTDAKLTHSDWNNCVLTVVFEQDFNPA